MFTKIGITGSNGLIGKILIKILKKKKIKYTCFKYDIRNQKKLFEWLKRNRDIDTIYHLAAIVPINLVNKNKQKSISVNFKGTVNIINSLKLIDKNFWFFFASTSHVYKPQKKLLRENDILKPSSFYGKTKLMSENFLLKNENKKIKICIGRIFSVFHKNQKKPFFYPVMLSKFKNRLNKRANYVLSGGNSIRDFSNAEMIANIIFKLSKKRVGGVINIGSGKKITLLEFIKKYINRYAQITASGKSNTIAANISKLKMLSILK
tara:strand:+ start:202 stop:993 length:792 start_codon:yes stop_codon:yes gene_type:complete